MAKWLLGICALSLIGQTATADVVIPKNVQYEFERTVDAKATSCNIVVLIVNYPAPEDVNFKILVTREIEREPIYLGFSADVGDNHFDKGAFAGLAHVPLKSASFTSDTFSSPGRMNEISPEDGGILASTIDPEAGAIFLHAFSAGNFSITFQRTDSSDNRTYLVTNGPSKDIFDKLLACAASLQTGG